MTRVLFAGDVHGNEERLRHLFRHAVDESVSAIVQVGDLGWWPHEKWGRQFIELLGYCVEATGVDLYFVPGNHENWDVLHAYEEQHKNIKQPFLIPTSSGIHEGLLYVPKGATFMLGGKTLMGFGGGFSVDWMYRTIGESWWPDELVTRAEVDALPEQKVDILVTHEVPESVPFHSWKTGFSDEYDQRRLVLEIVRKVKPDLVVCGHHHIRFSGHTFEGVPVEMLGDDRGPFESSFMILDV